MKKIILLTCTVLIPMLITGCFTFESSETHIRILKDEDGQYAQVINTYNNISSCEGLEKDVKNNFKHLIDMIEGDAYLLEAAKEGFYLKEREAWVDSNKIMVKEVGITSDFNYLREKYNLIRQGNEYLILIEKDNSILIETNGKTIETEKNIILYWPGEVSEELYFKAKPAEECGSFEKNRTLMVNWLKEHQSRSNK